MWDAYSLDVLFTVSSPYSLDLFCAHLPTTPREIRKLLSEYPDVLSSNGFSSSTPKHGVFHDLPTIPGPPVFAKASPLDPDKLAFAQAEFLKMEKAGIVHCSSSLWSSPHHMVPRPDGTWRPCISTDSTPLSFWTDNLSPPFLISQPESPDPSSSTSLISRRVTSRFP